MSGNETQLELTARVADLTRTGLPLEPGLRALAEEAPSRRTRRALLAVCARLERGASIEHVLAVPGSALPLHVAGLLSAGVRTGRIGDLLTRYLEQARRWQDLRRQAWSALIYPAILLATGMGVLAFYLLWLVPDAGVLFEEFAVELPPATSALLSLSSFLQSYGGWLLLGLIAMLLAVPALIVASGGRRAWAHAVSLVPLFGSMLRYSALAEFCHLLALLVRHDVPLPEALRMTAAGMADADLSASARELARFSEAGQRLEDADFATLRLPVSLRGAFRWEGRGHALPDSLEMAGEVFASLAAVRAEVIGMIAVPIILVGCGLLVAGTITILFDPLLALFGDLT